MSHTATLLNGNLIIESHKVDFSHKFDFGIFWSVSATLASYSVNFQSGFRLLIAEPFPDENTEITFLKLPVLGMHRYGGYKETW